MKYPKSTTQPPVTPHAYRNGVACSMLGVLALALLCSTPSTAQCVVGSNTALSFDGSNDAVSVSGSTAGVLDGLSDFAVECWFNASVAGDAPYRAILSKWYGTIPYWIGLLNGQIHIEFNPPYFAATFPNVDARDATWHHCAIVRQAGVITGFFDGAQVGPTVTYAPAVGVSTSPLTIGRRSDNQAVQFFSGFIDELRVWNVARSQTQIQSSMNVGLTGNEPGLVGYWRFDEGSGQTVFNSAVATGSALDGTLGANALPGTDDPTWISTGLPPLPYCLPCPAPPCGQVNSPCATLTVNGVGAAAQGPFNVVVPPTGTLSLNWSGPANQPYVLVATPGLVPGQLVFPPSFVVDINIGNYFLVYSGFDPVFGPLYFTNAAGTSGQTWTHPGVPLGVTMNVQGLMYDLALTCGSGLPFMTTASFAIQL